MGLHREKNWSEITEWTAIYNLYFYLITYEKPPPASGLAPCQKAGQGVGPQEIHQKLHIPSQLGDGMQNHLSGKMWTKWILFTP